MIGENAKQDFKTNDESSEKLSQHVRIDQNMSEMKGYQQKQRIKVAFKEYSILLRLNN